ncbi:hypothetical protein EJB05_53063 [Eragrostis curvula]|uniref:DUF4005 domain-containing protein n=1 Tax=Eragrostis curvula TaxID=38414 RepID=A0A5J9SR84_9POAL|nr:hypothetical protein EJB05_53063 [Eragrostis curvula]
MEEQRQQKGRKAKDRDKHQDDADAQSVSSAAPPAREKRRWSFRRPAAAVASRVEAGASSSSQCFSEAEVRAVLVQEHAQQTVAVVPEAATTTASTVVPLRPPAPETVERSGGGDDVEAAAAIKIQSAFRSYLARKALCALRGMVKLQAMVRGQLVRRQANTTLRRMQALVDAQRRARDERLRLLEDDDGRRLATATTATPRPPTSSRRSPQHHQRSRMSLEVVERFSEENVKILEVDDGGEAHGARRGGGCYTTPLSRTPAKAELYQKVSPTPSALTDASPRTLSGRFDDASLASASEPCRRRTPWRADHATPPFPSYMANTESSRAKARSQSAPRQRVAAASESGASVVASPSPSCGELLPPGWSVSGGGGARRRASLDPLDLLRARAGGAHWSSAGAAGRVERCPSGARARANASLPGSECGSSN